MTKQLVILDALSVTLLSIHLTDIDTVLKIAASIAVLLVNIKTLRKKSK